MELNELKIALTDCDKQLNENDWIEVERKLSCNIPLDLRKFYNLYNGGNVKGNLFLTYGNEITKLDFYSY